MVSSVGNIKLGVIGAGHMGIHHIKKLRDIGPRIGAEVTAVIDPDPARRQLVEREFQGMKLPQLLGNVGALEDLDRSIKPDALFIAVPATLHVPIAEAALKKGYHCFVEKPLGFSVSDCEELEQLAIKAKKLLQVGMIERWSLAKLWGNWRPQTGLTKFSLTVSRKGPFLPRVTDTDVVHDLMIHDLDMFVTLAATFEVPRISRLRSWGKKLRSENLDEVAAFFELEDGSHIRMFASRLSSESQRCWEMVGPGWHGTLDFMRREFNRFEKMPGGRNEFHATQSAWPGGDPLAMELETFVHRLRGTFDRSELSQYLIRPFSEDPAAIIPSARNVLKTHQLIDQIMSSMQVL